MREIHIIIKSHFRPYIGLKSENLHVFDNKEKAEMCCEFLNKKDHKSEFLTTENDFAYSSEYIKFSIQTHKIATIGESGKIL